MSMNYESCTLCPRMCGADRTKASGFCGASHQIKAARAALHQWEEPCISGTAGSGTVFFSGPEKLPQAASRIWQNLHKMR